ncbi:unnamed protein product [Didymodactylos carnosus]|uniref:Uncharacterized protein n=1 Tax=Didymodactylos carnosus TaxID=1234261 RepID=A0A814KYF1_9BILA|nr:unnamed protein product [Didymodactylos carnosus]CAF3826198.1 unnamed protein product [Didymodactylos carnosus]
MSPLDQVLASDMNAFDELIKINKNQSEKIDELIKMLKGLIDIPQTASKSIKESSDYLKMATQVTTNRKPEEDENLVLTLNDVNLSTVPAGSSFTTTARNIIRAAYGNQGSFFDLKAGEFHILLGVVAYLHKLKFADVWSKQNSIRISAAQMKHDTNKKSGSPMAKKQKIAHSQTHEIAMKVKWKMSHFSIINMGSWI